MYTFITGASSGIGKSCAEKFAEKGHNLILLARNIKSLKTIKRELETEYEVDVVVYGVDVSDTTAINDCIMDVQKNNYKINLCINNAGLALGEDEFSQVDWKDLDTMIQVNIKGFTQIAHTILPFLRETDGHIFNMSSIAGIESYEGGHVYCASKAYVKMLSKSLRIELMGTGVRVTDIAPGAVQTDGFAITRFKGDLDKAQNVYAGYEPLQSKDIIDCIEFCFDRPNSVNIEYLLIMPTAQASARRISKK